MQTPIVMLLAVFMAAAFQTASDTPRHKVIFDTDFVVPPQDDGLALILALQSPELEVLGVTTVAGNRSMEDATADALRALEIAGRTDIPVFKGANMPLVHEKSDFATTVHGTWWSDDPPRTPPGGFAKKRAESASAIEFIVRTVMENPGQITIAAIGPLTNIATAIRLEPGFAQRVKQLNIMGGAIAILPDGGGNLTPNAEFNFWVDPEAAKVVLHSGIPVILSPLNVTRKTRFTKEWYDMIVSVDTPITRLLKERMGPRFAENPSRGGAMHDQVAVASIFDLTLFQSEEMYVDVDTNHGINYGVSVGGRRLWPGAEGARKIRVLFDIDWERFINMFVRRLTSPVPTQGRS
ncbi:MAG: nucleoside hydrolase [Acidobacteriota bacterium]